MLYRQAQDPVAVGMNVLLIYFSMPADVPFFTLTPNDFVKGSCIKSIGNTPVALIDYRIRLYLEAQASEAG
jgi:hypothetical protein